MTITVPDIKKLRQRTGAGMMTCKQVLEESGGDFNQAIELLRKKGQKVAADRASKATTEGLVLAEVNITAQYGVIIALGCETDFVANNDTFRQLAQNIVAAALVHKPTSLEALMHLEVAGRTCQEQITSLIGKMGENITLNAYDFLSSQVVVSYVHLGGKLGALVALQGAQGTAVVEAGRNVAMQVAAMNPVAVHQDGVGKDAALLSQLFIKDNKLTVAQYLNKVAPTLAVVSFKRIVLGV